MDHLLNEDGKKYCAVMNGTSVKGVISVEKDTVYLCQDSRDGAGCKNLYGYRYSWDVASGSDDDLENSGVEDFELIDDDEEIKTINKLHDDWKVGRKDYRRIT